MQPKHHNQLVLVMEATNLLRKYFQIFSFRVLDRPKSHVSNKTKQNKNKNRNKNIDIPFNETDMSEKQQIKNNTNEKVISFALLFAESENERERTISKSKTFFDEIRRDLFLKNYICGFAPIFCM